MKQLQSVRSQLAQLTINATDPIERQIQQQQLSELMLSERELLRELRLAGKVNVGKADDGAPDWIESDQIQNALSSGSVLVDIARIEVFDFDADDRTNPWQSARYVAWVTRHTDGTDSTLIDLGDAAAIDASVESTRTKVQNAAASIEANGEEQAAADLKSELSELSEKIWQPVERILDDVNEIVLSPDGALWLAPWTSLPLNSDGGDEQFLLERYTIRFVVSARELVNESERYEARPPVIMANPNFDQKLSDKQKSIQAIFKKITPPDDVTTRGFAAKSMIGKVPALPNTGLEAIAIQPNLEKFAAQKASVYKERYALERVAKALQGPQVVTFATHGFFLNAQTIQHNDREQLSADDTQTMATTASGQLVENPLLRCGLLLSGCNDRESVVGDDDGILTGLEIVTVDFRGTELVVLSACETAVGEVRNGEGVAGLRQAFQLAGAQSVVSTLWQVPDRDSALIMSEFFTNLADGQTRAAALRNAQLARIESRRSRYGAAHPFYWAAWTYTGQ